MVGSSVMAVQTSKAKFTKEKLVTMEAKERGFDNHSPLWERRIPIYDALKVPYCRMFQASGAAPQLRRAAPDA